MTKDVLKHLPANYEQALRCVHTIVYTRMTIESKNRKVTPWIIKRLDKKLDDVSMTKLVYFITSTVGKI